MTAQADIKLRVEKRTILTHLFNQFQGNSIILLFSI